MGPAAESAGTFIRSSREAIATVTKILVWDKDSVVWQGPKGKTMDQPRVYIMISLPQDQHATSLLMAQLRLDNTAETG
jgi:hypothetical protein